MKDQAETAVPERACCKTCGFHVWPPHKKKQDCIDTLIAEHEQIQDERADLAIFLADELGIPYTDLPDGERWPCDTAIRLLKEWNPTPPLPSPMVTVQSSNLDAVAYDVTTKRLLVRFVGWGGAPGRRYLYEDVPPDMHGRMMKAESVGKFLNQNIKGTYKFKRLED